MIYLWNYIKSCFFNSKSYDHIKTVVMQVDWCPLRLSGMKIELIKILFTFFKDTKLIISALGHDRI